MLIAGLFVPMWILILVAVLVGIAVLNLFMLLLAPFIGLKILLKIVKLVFKILKILFPIVLIMAGGYLLLGTIF